jgi:phosphoglycolate phosphatase
LTIAHRSWKAVIFDFDGTLARLNIDFAGMRAALLDLLARYRIPAAGIMNLHILEMIEAAAALLAQHRPAEATLFLQAAHALITKKEIDAAADGALFETTRTLLAELQRRSIRTGVVTRNCRAAVLKIFPDIDRCCRAVLAREDTCRVKPDPEHLMAALRILRANPAEAVMVGDHPLDIELGRRAGTFTIGVLTGNSSQEALLQANADMIVPDAPSILDIIT